MSPVSYTLITASLFAFELVMSIVFDDITTLFAFASAVAVSFICFWFPGCYYLLATRSVMSHRALNISQDSDKDSGEQIKTGSKTVIAWVFVAMGFVNCALGLYAAFVTLKH